MTRVATARTASGPTGATPDRHCPKLPFWKSVALPGQRLPVRLVVRPQGERQFGRRLQGTIMAMLVGRFGGEGTARHSYEEVRDAAIAVLRKSQGNASGQYNGFRSAIAECFAQSEGTPQQTIPGHNQIELSRHDADLAQEVFWALFREGITTLGIDAQNPNFPFYRVTGYGHKVLSNQDPYFFTDVSDYERILKARLPYLDDVTTVYVKEAVQTFKIGSVLASSVMIGVASEHTFNRLVETVQANTIHQGKFAKVYKEVQILRRLNAFKAALDAHQELTNPAIREDLDTRFLGVISLIRTFRNEAGHPTGKIIDREQAYVNLQLFIPYAEKLYQLMEFYK